MGDFLGGLVGAVGDVFGGLMNTSSAQAINSANLAQQMFLANNSVSMRVADAKRAGINPLAALGVSSPGFVGATPTEPGSGVAAAGQDIARAISANKDRSDKLDDLQRAEIQSRIDENDANTQYIRSKTVRALASPGSPPVRHDAFIGPTAPWLASERPKPALQAFQTQFGTVYTPSREVTESQFSALPGVTATPSLMNAVATANAPEGDAIAVRPDLFRSVAGGYPSATEIAP